MGDFLHRHSNYFRWHPKSVFLPVLAFLVNNKQVQGWQEYSMIDVDYLFHKFTSESALTSKSIARRVLDFLT